MNTPTVAFDESGNSKENLLDPTQPIFALASVHFTDDEASSLLELMPQSQAPEYKFSGQRRNAKGRAGIIRILNSELFSRDKIAVSIYDKSFMATAKMVDVLIEPLLYNSGIDMYEDGQNRALANIWHIGLRTIIGNQTFDNLQQAFVTLMRQRQPSDVTAFYALVSSLQALDLPESVKMHFSMLAATELIVDGALRGLETTLLDPAIPTFVRHCGYWTAKLKEEFNVLYDVSEPIQHEAELLCQLTAPDEPSMQYDHHGEEIVFPSKAITPFSFIDSKHCFSIQIADLIAGASTYWARGMMSGDQDEFWDLLNGSKLKEVITDAVWPELPVVPEASGSHDNDNAELLDHVGRLLSGTGRTVHE